MADRGSNTGNGGGAPFVQEVITTPTVQGFPYPIGSTTTSLLINPLAGSLPAWSGIMPAQPVEGQLLEVQVGGNTTVMGSPIVVQFSLQAASGQTGIGLPFNLQLSVGDQPLSFRYSLGVWRKNKYTLTEHKAALIASSTGAANDLVVTGNDQKISGINLPDIYFTTDFGGDGSAANPLSGTALPNPLVFNATISIDQSSSGNGPNVSMPHTGNITAITFTSRRASKGMIILTNGNGGTHTLTFPAGSVLLGTLSSPYSLMTTQGKVDLIEYIDDGVTLYFKAFKQNN